MTAESNYRFRSAIVVWLPESTSVKTQVVLTRTAILFDNIERKSS